MRKELSALREKMAAESWDVVIIPTGDFHGSEYINDYFKTRKYISGFTGSAGTLVVAKDWAGLWTDGRYFLQASMQLEGTGIDLMKMAEPGVPTVTEWLASYLRPGMVLEFDGRVVSAAAGEAYAKTAEEAGASVVFDKDPADGIWQDRPALTGKEVWALPPESAGYPFTVKIRQVRDRMKERGAAYHLITGLEENAWLYNLRGFDVAYTPVFFSFTLITPKESRLYVFPGNGADELIAKAASDMPKSATVYSKGVTYHDYFDVWKDVAELPAGAALLADRNSLSYSLLKTVPEGVELIDALSPATELKAIKNPAEIAATRNAHIKDGRAMAEFLFETKLERFGSFYEYSHEINVTESYASGRLTEHRKAKEGYIEDSFETIPGYMENGAIIHYSVTPESDRQMADEGLLLVDSGGQYISGTTDITRTIALGALTDKMKECYTAVLKGHIDLAMAKFPDGTTGIDLDKIARAPIKAIGLDYNHGTGHGVGHVLSVHEGPNNISPLRGGHPITPGMITTDEPGVYLEGEFGVRIEGELLCVKLSEEERAATGNDYGFEMLTLCPYERDAIIKERLTPEELEWLNAYHQRVYETISPYLDDWRASWLRQECSPL